MQPDVGPPRSAGPSDSLSPTEVLRFTSRPNLEGAPLVIGWTKDTGAVARLAVDYLIGASNGSGFCQIEPTAFYSLGGVPVTDDVAQFPQSRFFYSPSRRIVLLRADEPQSNRYEFLNAVLGLAHQGGKAEALYTVNGIAALNSHTAARRVSGIFNAPFLQGTLRQWVPADLNWQGPPHTSTYLLWLAGRRHLPGAGLWVEVPFYLADYEDYQSAKAAVSLLSMILGLEIDLTRLNQLAAEQDEKLAQLYDDPETAQKMHALERGESLDRQDQLDLIEAAGHALK
jgi:hypothetical protein